MIYFMPIRLLPYSKPRYMIFHSKSTYHQILKELATVHLFCIVTFKNDNIALPRNPLTISIFILYNEPPS